MMYIFKIILGICSTIFTYRAIIENNLEKAYDYLFSGIIMFSVVVLVQPII